MKMNRIIGLILSITFVVNLPAVEDKTSGTAVQTSTGVFVASFDVDVTPPLGSPLAYIKNTWVDKPLSARGIILRSEQDNLPLVLCAVDWIGIGNEGQDAWKEALAEAAGTLPSRVSVHTNHQHDAPVCDFTTQKILFKYGAHKNYMDPVFSRKAISDCAQAIQLACKSFVQVTHIGTGKAEVKEVASNRRILGEDGKVRATRYTATADPKLRAEPVGIIDPNLRLVSFWNDSTPIAVLSFYATHPQSYYRRGGANPDFPGMAREFRETQTDGIRHIHFTGAGGNIGAGKWNDGKPANRVLLATKLANGMKEAWEQTQKNPISSENIDWKSLPFKLPVAGHLKPSQLVGILENPEASETEKKVAAAHLAWVRRSEERQYNATVSRLRIGDVDLLFLPGETVVEYQLEAQEMKPDSFVCMVAYGDYGPGYICRELHYTQGGYEASPGASRVSPNAEKALVPIIRAILE